MKKLYSISILLLVTIIATAQQTGLKSYSLQEAISYALQNSHDVKNALLDQEAAKARNHEIITTGLPQISASVDYNYYFKKPIVPALSQFFLDTTSATSRVLSYQASTDTTIRNILYQSAVDSKDQKISFVLANSLGASLQLTQLIFDARYLFGIKATKDLLKTSRLTKQLTDNEVKYNVTKAYYQARSAQEANALLKNTLDLVQKLLSDTKKTFEQGLIEELDVDRLSLIEANLQTQISTQNQMAEVALSNLKFQMGLPLNDEIMLTDNLEDLKTLANVADAATFDAKQRLEYELLSTAIRLKGFDMQAKRSSYYPSLVGFLNYGWTAQTEKFGDIFKTTTQYYPDGDSRKISPWYSQGLVGISLKLPIFDSGQKMAQVKQAKLDQQKTMNDLENFQNAAELQYRVASSSLKSAVADQGNAKRAVDLSEKIFKTNQIKYQQGVGSSFELVQSEQDFISNQLKYVQSTMSLLNAKADLDKALGK
jgi:outer membrane protein TolC